MTFEGGTFKGGESAETAQAGAPDFGAAGAKPPRRLRTVLIALAATFLLTVILLGLARAFVFSIYYLPSESMTPALELGDRIVVNRLDRSPERGDVIVHTQEGSGDSVKRVIAVGGETVEVVGGQLLIDGEAVVEPYLDPTTVTDDFAPVTVPADSLFLMGDNRPFSFDSRFSGPVSTDAVVGTVIGA